ncbi:MAG: hypothetical protein IPF74_11210 [Rhodocyclaceae bacterium]|nr:hypothetical protein [Rhodocyclaceae bacterium]
MHRWRRHDRGGHDGNHAERRIQAVHNVGVAAERCGRDVEAAVPRRDGKGIHHHGRTQTAGDARRDQACRDGLIEQNGRRLDLVTILNQRFHQRVRLEFAKPWIVNDIEAGDAMRRRQRRCLLRGIAGHQPMKPGAQGVTQLPGQRKRLLGATLDKAAPCT